MVWFGIFCITLWVGGLFSSRGSNSPGGCDVVPVVVGSPVVWGCVFG